MPALTNNERNEYRHKTNNPKTDPEVVASNGKALDSTSAFQMYGKEQAPNVVRGSFPHPCYVDWDRHGCKVIGITETYSRGFGCAAANFVRSVMRRFVPAPVTTFPPIK